MENAVSISGGAGALGPNSLDAISLGRRISTNVYSVSIAEKLLYGDELHLLVFGPNGSGKTTRLLMTNLLSLENRSIFVVDPKGELAAVTAPFRRTVSNVVIINPFGVHIDRPGYEDLKSDGFNPLLSIDPASTSFNSDAALLAEALISIESKDPHWDRSARELLAALIMYVCIEARRLGHTPTIGDVRALLCMACEEPTDDREGSGIPAIALEMIKSNIAGLRNKAGQFKDWTNEIRSVASAARQQTESFDDDEIAIDLAKGAFDFREMKERPTTVYLILPPDMLERHAKWLRLLVTSALRGVLRLREPGEPKALFMLDEFAALGHLQIIETVWAQVRGYGIQIMPVLQDIHQLKTIYKDRWETFVGQAGVVATFGARDMASAKWMSERAGEKTVVAASLNTSRSAGPTGDSYNESMSMGQVKVPFMTPHKFLGLRGGTLAIWLAGVRDTIPAYAPAYWEITKLLDRQRANPYYQKVGRAI